MDQYIQYQDDSSHSPKPKNIFTDQSELYMAIRGPQYNPNEDNDSDHNNIQQNEDLPNLDLTNQENNQHQADRKLIAEEYQQIFERAPVNGMPMAIRGPQYNLNEDKDFDHNNIQQNEDLQILDLRNQENNDLQEHSNLIAEEDQQIFEKPQVNRTQAKNNTSKPRVYTNQKSINKTSPITKNVPKSLGKGYKKFLQDHDSQLGLKEIKEYQEFINTENKKLRIESFNNIIQNDQLKKLLEFYLENCFVIDLAHSKKVAPETYIPIIKAYLKGIKKGKIEGQTSQ